MTETPNRKGPHRGLQIAVVAPLVLSLIGCALFLIINSVGGRSQIQFMYAITAFTTSAALTGLVAIGLFVLARVKNPQRLHQYRVGFLIPAFSICVVQFFLLALGYLFYQKPELSDFCFYGAGASIASLLVSALVESWIRRT